MGDVGRYNYFLDYKRPIQTPRGNSGWKKKFRSFPKNIELCKGSSKKISINNPSYVARGYWWVQLIGVLLVGEQVTVINTKRL